MGVCLIRKQVSWFLLVHFCSLTISWKRKSQSGDFSYLLFVHSRDLQVTIRFHTSGTMLRRSFLERKWRCVHTLRCAHVVGCLNTYVNDCLFRIFPKLRPSSQASTRGSLLNAGLVEVQYCVLAHIPRWWRWSFWITHKAVALGRWHQLTGNGIQTKYT